MIVSRSIPLWLVRFALLSFPLIIALPLPAEATNNATVLEQSSNVPGSAGSGATVAVMVRVQNTGKSVWRSGNLHRLGASSQNQVSWSGYRCGGYMGNPLDGRVFLCHDVAPGQTHDFHFNVTVPSSGSARLSVRMVQDAVEWFGETQTWTISVSGGGNNLPDVVVTSQRIEPSSPQPGQSVRFVSVVRNQGNATTPSGTVIGVGYFIDGRWVSYGYSSNRLAPGSSVTITTQGELWRATSGRHTFTAVVDDVNRFPESNETNNSRSMSFTVGSGGGCPTNPVSTPSDRWKLEIFNNRDLSGSPVEIRTDAAGSGGFTFNWGSGRTSNCTGNDNFSVRFSRRIHIGTSGTYKFTTRTDDGVRLYVDGQLLINRWIDQAPTSYSASKSLSAGWYDVRMDYYEHGGGAYASVRWERQSSGGGEGNLYGMNIDPANGHGDPSAQDLKNIGVRWVRIEYKSHKGQAFYDSKIAKYRNEGIKVLLIVDYASVPGKPSGSGTDSQWASYLSTFNSGLRTIASHYRNNVDAWQIWNEPDLSPQPGYDVYVPAKHFGAMLRDSVTAIRQVSSRPVITGGLASGNPNYLSEARSAAGGLTVDAVAVHPYGQRAPDDWPNPSWGFGNMSTLFDRYLAFGKPLWVTEIGVNTPDEGFQADYLENVYVLARDRYRDRVQVVFWFCWSDGMVPPFGILRSNGEQKPAYHQYRAVAPPY